MTKGDSRRAASWADFEDFRRQKQNSPPSGFFVRADSALYVGHVTIECLSQRFPSRASPSCFRSCRRRGACVLCTCFADAPLLIDRCSILTRWSSIAWPSAPRTSRRDLPAASKRQCDYTHLTYPKYLVAQSTTTARPVGGSSSAKPPVSEQSYRAGYRGNPSFGYRQDVAYVNSTLHRLQVPALQLSSSWPSLILCNSLFRNTRSVHRYN